MRPTHRAREHVHARRPRFDADPGQHRQITERFLAACYSGDLDGLLELLAPGVVLISDGGGKAKAALRPITDAGKVARFLAGIGPDRVGQFSVGYVTINGQLGVIAEIDSVPTGAGLVKVAGGRIERVFIITNPDKLSGIAAPA